jgi:Uncharacterized protein conserved in bacteria
MVKKPEMPDGFDETMEQLSSDAVHLVKTNKKVFTRIGGQPLASKNFEWPKWKGQSLAFIMQIKLSEVSLLSQFARFPQKGLLYVFYDKEQSTWGFDPKDKGSWKIIFEPEQDDLAIVPYPEDIEDDYWYKELKLEQKLIKTYPSWEDEKIEALKLNQEQTHCYINFCCSPYQNKSGHQIGGIACDIQGPGMDLECQLVSNGLNCGDERGYKGKKAKELEKHRSDWMLLLQIDSDDNAGFMWGDMGMLYFWIKKEDLEKSNFENVWMILQCG